MKLTKNMIVFTVINTITLHFSVRESVIRKPLRLRRPTLQQA